MKKNELLHHLDLILSPHNFKDYCPNGLQVAGCAEINTIITGVTASMDLLEAAKAKNADAILVHHGYFWRGEAPEIVGIKQQRIKFLLQHDINLMAYHLPLDAHAKLGNNVQLGNKLGFKQTGWTGENNLVALGKLVKPQTLAQLSQHIEKTLCRTPQTILSKDTDAHKVIKTVAWCTGAAQGYIEEAIKNQIDVFISGEISEQTVHLARESNTAYIAAGHHATERYGIQALGEYLAEKFKITHHFLDMPNPV